MTATQRTRMTHPVVNQLRHAIDEGRSIAAHILLEELDAMMSGATGSYIVFLESQRDSAFADLQAMTAAHDTLLAHNAALRTALALVIESYEAGDGAMATKQVIDHVRSILATQRVTP